MNSAQNSSGLALRFLPQKLILGSISSGTATENITKSFYLKRENSFFELRKLNPRYDFLNKQNFAKKCLPNVKKMK